MEAPLHRRTEKIGACLADPSANGEGAERSDTFTIPERAQAAGVSTRQYSCAGPRRLSTSLNGRSWVKVQKQIVPALAYKPIAQRNGWHIVGRRMRDEYTRHRQCPRGGIPSLGTLQAGGKRVMWCRDAHVARQMLIGSFGSFQGSPGLDVFGRSLVLPHSCRSYCGAETFRLVLRIERLPAHRIIEHRRNMRPRIEATVHVFVSLALLAGVLFGSAGRTDLIGFWFYFAAFAAVSMASLVLVDPTLAQERLRPGGRRFEPRLVFVTLWMVCHWMVAGLDRGRFHWSDTVPVWLRATALVFFATALSLILWAAHVNRFASSVLRIQTDRGHHVVTGGPYAVVRHPIYLAAVVLFIVSGLTLGSWFAVITALPGVPLILWATDREDRFLQEHLPGYRDYTQRVLYRIIPSVW
jgi:protein-S-isoprenylcysteine O-methyltransferase Ste14